jgi:microtubule-associated protein-like 6
LFSDCTGEEATDSLRLRISVLSEVFTAHPDVRCWFAFFGNPLQSGLQLHELMDEERDYKKENPIISRSVENAQAIEWNICCTSKNKEEADKALKEKVPEPWKASVAMLTPVQYANTAMPTIPPESSMSLEWVYGYQAEKSRNTVRYNYQGNLVYNASKYAIVYGFDSNSQNIFTGHSEEILCLTVHPKGQVIASGDSGPIPRLIVWHSVTQEILFTDTKFHRNGIIHVSFSLDGKLLAAVGNDTQHSLAVYRWADNEVLFTSHVNPGPCLCCCFMLDGTVAVGGESYLYFWSKAPEGYIKRKGNFSRFTLLQPITCVAHVGSADNLVSGTASGQIFLWADRNCIRNVKGHEGTVNAVYSATHGVLTGGKDKRVRMWTHKLEPGASFDMSNFGYNPCIRSVCMSVDGSSILVGTMGSNIFEISAIDGSDLRGGPIANGHSYGELSCITCHPSKHECATVGDDKHLRIWDMNNHSLIKVAVFDAAAKAVAYSPLGDSIVVGLGGGKEHAKCGAFVIINEEDMSVIHEARDCACPISICVFSPEGEILAVGAEDGAIYLYAVQDEFEMIGRCIRHTQPVTQIDFSSDGEWLRSNSIEKDLCFFNSDDASYQSNLPSMRDVLWSSHSCIYSWHVKSVHRTSNIGEEVICVHTPNSTPKYVVGGTNYGFLKLHLFPCVGDLAEYHRFPAHVDAVADVKFSFDENRLISIGLKDRCILQWKTATYDDIAEDLDGHESEDFGLESREGEDIVLDFIPKRGAVVDSLLNAKVFGEVSVLPSTPSVDAWLESVVAPVAPGVQHKTVPDMSVRLEHVYGYKCQDMRNNVRYNNQGDVVFVSATIGVSMTKSRAQTFFQSHTDAITSFSCSRDGRLVASGQMGHKPFVAVWDSITCKTLKKITDPQLNAISALAFSKSSKLLAMCSLDKDHSISVIDWQRDFAVSRIYAGANHILSLSFSDDDNEIVACGIKCIKFWKNCQTREPTMIKANFGEIGKRQKFLCSEYFAGMATIGCGDGNLYVFSEGALRHVVKSHDSSVLAMDVSQDQEKLVTGGKDGVVRIWNHAYECIKEITVDSCITSQCNRVRSVCFSEDANSLVIGTRGAEIFEVSTKMGQLIGGKPLVSGHGTRELWGLSAHPTKEEFATSGDDATIRIWDTKSCSIIKTVKVDTASRAIAYSPSGKYLAVGFGYGKKAKGKAPKEGAFAVLTSGEMKMVHEGKDSNEPIRVVRFSPDSNYLAVGSEDSCIYIYNCRDRFTRRSTISCHKSPIQSVDFNKDGTFVQSVDLTKRLCFSEVATGKHITSPATLRDEKWSTWSSSVGWPVQGMWMCQPAGVEPVTTQRSWGGALLATGNTAGRLFVTHYPCQDRAGFVGSVGHSGPIAQVAWVAGDGVIISIGVKDFSILQWKCIYDTTRESGDEGGISCEDSDVNRTGGHEFKIAKKKKVTNFSSTKPWQSTIYPPSDVKENDSNVPSTRMDLDFVHGIRIGDCRQVVRYNEDGNLVYIVVSMGVIYARDEQKQTVYMGHTKPLISIDVDATGKIAATGELADIPEIHIWDARTAQHISTFKECHRVGVSSLSFSPSGEYLVSLGQDAMNSVVVMRSPSKRWIDGCVQSCTSVSSSKMFWCMHVGEQNDYPIIVGGKGTIFFFRTSGKTLERIRGVFGKSRKLQPILCAVATNNPAGERTILTGTVTGHIYSWVKQRVVDTITAHDAPIYAIAKLWQGYATGGKDGLVKLWTSELQLLHTYNIMTFSPQPSMTSCHSVRVNMIGSKMVISMRSGEVYEISLPVHSHMLLIEGHSYQQLHGLDVNPVNADEYATTGDDGMLRIWSILRKTCIRRLALEAAARSIAFSPDGKRLIIGIGGNPSNATKEGAYMVVDSETLEVIMEDRKAKQYITDIKYSVAGCLAFSSQDGKVYLHDATSYALIKAIAIPSKNVGVRRIDFSEDGSVIRLATSADELFHYTVSTGEIISLAATVRDMKWATCNCPYTWFSQGIVRPHIEEINVVSATVNARKNLIACTYENGDVRVYMYPCQQTGALYLDIRGVASIGSRILFTADNRFLLIIDAQSRAVMQYRLSPQ